MSFILDLNNTYIHVKFLQNKLVSILTLKIYVWQEHVLFMPILQKLQRLAIGLYKL
jgi:hypothetical protein